MVLKFTGPNTTQTTANPCFAMGSPRSGCPLAARLEPAILGPSVNSSKIIADINKCQKITRL